MNASRRECRLTQHDRTSHGKAHRHNGPVPTFRTNMTNGRVNIKNLIHTHGAQAA